MGQKKQDNEWPDFLSVQRIPRSCKDCSLQTVLCAVALTFTRGASGQRSSTQLRSSRAGACPPWALTRTRRLQCWVISVVRGRQHSCWVKAMPTCPELDQRLVLGSHRHPGVSALPPRPHPVGMAPLFPGFMGICLSWEAAISLSLSRHCAKCSPFLPGVDIVHPFYSRKPSRP